MDHTGSLINVLVKVAIMSQTVTSGHYPTSCSWFTHKASSMDHHHNTPAYKTAKSKKSNNPWLSYIKHFYLQHRPAPWISPEVDFNHSVTSQTHESSTHMAYTKFQQSQAMRSSVIRLTNFHGLRTSRHFSELHGHGRTRANH